MAKVFSKGEGIEKEEKNLFFLSFRRLLILILILIFLNLLILDLMVFMFLNGNRNSFSNTPTLKSASNDQSFCSNACISKINKLQSAINNKQGTVISVTPAPPPVKSQATVQTAQSQTVKEYYVPFGSGSGSSTNWQDVAGLQAYIDSTSYPNIKSVVFEVSLHVPTGNETASVRLYDATDNHPVWNSQVDFPGSTQSVFLTSQPITLDSGNKLYVVQMMTQLQFTAVVDQSRVHITTQ